MPARRVPLASHLPRCGRDPAHPTAGARRKASVSRFEEQNRFFGERHWLTATENNHEITALGRQRFARKRHQAHNPSV